MTDKRLSISFILVLFTLLLMTACTPVTTTITTTFPTVTTTVTSTLQYPDDLALRPYVHFVRLVVEGTKVSPSEADLPISPTTTNSLFGIEQNLELVFFMEKEASVSVQIENDENGGIVFNKEEPFSDSTGIAYSNLMRPPGITLRENIISIGNLEPGNYILHIDVEELSEDIFFNVI